ncbi:MAG: fumarate reductase [Rhodoferax sp.]|nr:fumarate reductase [Rhodoferax sp.]
MPGAAAPQWDREVDLLILGAGAAGMATGLVASLEGLKPLILEKSQHVGGTAATSAGTIWIPGNQQSLDAGYHDNVREAEAYLDKLVGSPDTAGLRRAFLETGPRVVDYLRQKTDVHFVPSGKHPDYRDLAGAAVLGRTLAPAVFDAGVLGQDFERVRPPIPEFMVLGGMMAGKDDIPRLIGRFRSVGNFVYAGRLFWRYLMDRLRFSRGARVVMGNALVSRLFYSIKKQGVPVMFGARVTALVHAGEAVVGAVVDTGAESLRVRALRGVVIATGGFGHSDKLRKEFMPYPTPPYSVAAADNTGDGIELGRRYGGQAPAGGAGEAAFWTPVSVTRRPGGVMGVYPHLSLDRAKPGLIAVNGAGQRFVNEADSYHDFVIGMYRSHRSAPTIPAYLICEKGFVAKYGLGNIHPGTRNLARFEREAYVTVADTLAELAGRIGLDAAALQATLVRYNGFAREGRDLDFGKGETELNRFNGDARVKPNPCLAEIKTGPFVALAVYPAEIGTSAGLATDPDGRVLNAQGQPIAGLYACGADMASVMAGTYPGPGTTLGPALTFGYRVAMHAAGKTA